MSIWDDPELRTGGDFIKFDAVGDTVTGTITGLRAHRWEDGSVCPQLFLTVDGEERTLTAGQVRLKAALAEQRPEVGDTLTVTLTDVQKRAGGKTLKVFDVKVLRGNGSAPAPAAPTPAPSATLDDASLTPEQIQAKKLLGLA